MESIKASQFKNNQIASISLEAAAQKAPAIMASQPASYTTERYVFTPTTEIISHMQDLGFLLTDAKQATSKKDLRNNYGTHLIRMAHPDLYIKDTNGDVEARPEIVIMNSHDGVKPLQFDMGLFRLVCSNGLVVKSQDMGHFRERHSRITFQYIKDLISQKVESLPKLVEKINVWSGRTMSALEQRDFAIQALALRIGEDRQPESYELDSFLNPRREADKANTLWNVYNRAQESLIKGGYESNNRTARAIINPLTDLQLNQGIWQLAESFE